MSLMRTHNVRGMVLGKSISGLPVLILAAETLGFTTHVCSYRIPVFCLFQISQNILEGDTVRRSLCEITRPHQLSSLKAPGCPT